MGRLLGPDCGRSRPSAASTAARSTPSRPAGGTLADESRLPRSAATSAGWRARPSPHGSVAACPLRRGSPAAPARPEQADAAEVVVQRRPAPDAAGPSPRARRAPLVDARLGVDDVAGRGGSAAARRPRPDRAPRRGSRPRRRRARSAAACRPPSRSRARGRPPSNASVGAIMLCHPLARPERLADEVDLAEHAVQLQVEAGEEVARAEAEARREHARVRRRRPR